MNIKSLYILLLVLLFSQSTYCADNPNASHVKNELERIELERKYMFSNDNNTNINHRDQFPTNENIAKEKKAIESTRKDMFSSDNPLTKNAPNNFPNILIPETSGIDIESIAQRYEQKSNNRKMNDLMVFASFSMPKESLKRLVRETNRVGGSVLFFGFKENSLKSTLSEIRRLGEERGNIQIAPDAFSQYKIDAVPTVVLVKASSFGIYDKEGCALPENYTAITGDVSLAYALEEIAKRDPDFSNLATRYASLIEGM